MSEMVEVKVPDIGDFDNVEIIEILVAVGDVVAEEDSLITVETDKATMEIPSSHSGTVKEVKVKLGDTISQGGLVVVLESSGATAVKEQAPAEVKEETQLKNQLRLPTHKQHQQHQQQFLSRAMLMYKQSLLF